MPHTSVAPIRSIPAMHGDAMDIDMARQQQQHPIITQIERILLEFPNDSAAHPSDASLLVQQQILQLFRLHLQGFCEQMVMRRRRMQEKYRRRQQHVLTVFQQQLLDTETTFIKMLPHFVRTAKRTTQRCRTRTRNRHWYRTKQPKMPKFSFYQNLIKNFSDQQWRSRFRMSKQTYDWLCQQLGANIQQQATGQTSVHAVDVPKRIAIALYALASGDDYRDIAILFDITRNAVSHVVKRFAEAFLDVMGKQLLSLPSTRDEYDSIRKGFHQATNMPPIVVGVLGHIKVPIYNVTAEENARDGAMQSLTLETVVDNSLLFRNMIMHKKQPCLLWHAPNQITKLPHHLVSDRHLPSVVATPRVFYPLTDWLLHQYDDPLAPHEFDFNEALDNLLGFNEQAYLRLFGRWKILAYKNAFDFNTLSRILVACCALHNLMEQLLEPFDEQWSQNLDMSKFQFTDSDALAVRLPQPTERALEMRDFLARTISSTEM